MDECRKQAEERLSKDFPSTEQLTNEFCKSFTDKTIAELQRILDDAQYREDTILTCKPYENFLTQKDNLQDRNSDLAKATVAKSKHLEDLMNEYFLVKQELDQCRKQAEQHALRL